MTVGGHVRGEEVSRRARRILCLAMVFLLGCERGPSSVASPVQFMTEDGFTIHADLVRASDPEAPVAILLHMYRSNRKAWKPLISGLRAAGFSVLALDQRAHGESTQQGHRTVRVEEIPRSAFGSVVRAGVGDVAAARAFLARKGLSTNRIVLVGASYGCSVSLLAANRVDGVRALVLLSPGVAYFGVGVVEEARRFQGPLLAIAAEDDPQAVASAGKLVDVHMAEDRLLVYPSGGHGTGLFGPRPDVKEVVVEFLRQRAFAEG